MSSSIDERIVDMQFNNREFETGVKDTLSSLDNLKKGLSNIDDAGGKVSFAGIAEGVAAIADRFSTFGIVAMTVLQNITNAAIETGKALIKSLALDPLMDGFREYELQMGAVKVMMANLGDKTTMAQINSALDDLNAYADLTIYNFGEMTDAVGKFTAAGVGLEDSTMAIKGLSNIAAGAGVPAYKMKNAYLQVSQALQAGTFRLMDWNSMQNAGLANEEFRNRLLANAEAIDGFTLGSNTFRESLKDGWLTTEVFLATMKEATDQTDDWGKRLYAAATEITTFSQLMGTLREAMGTSWGDSFKIIIGDFLEAKELWTNVNDTLSGMISASSKARNDMLREWKSGGGRDILIDSFKNVFDGLVQIIGVVQEAFREIFPPTTSEQLLQFTKNLNDLTSKFKLSDESAENLKSTFKGLFAAFDLVGMGISALFELAGKLIGVFPPLEGGFLGLTGGIGDFIVSLRDSAIDGDIFGKGLENIGVVLDKVKEVIKRAGDGVKEGISKLKEYFGGFSGINLGPLSVFSKDVEVAFSPFSFIASGFKKAWDVIVGVFQWAAPIVAPIAKKIGDAFTDFGRKIGEAIRNGDFKSLLDLINTGLLGGVILGIKNFVDSLSEVTSGAGGFVKGVTEILDGVRGSLEAYQSKLKSQTLLTIAGAIALLSGALLILSTIDAADMASSLAIITVLFIELAGVMLVLSNNMGGIKMGATAAQMIGISVAILILSSALKNLSDLDPEQLVQGLLAIGLMMAEFAGFTQLVKPEKLLSTGVAMIALGAGLKIIGNVVQNLGAMEWEEIAKGLLTIGLMMAELAGFTQLVKPEKLMTTGVAMIALGAGLKIIGNVVQNLGGMEWEAIAKGLLTLGGILAELAVFTQLVNPAQILSTGVAMIAMGAGLKIIGNVVQNLGSMEWEEIGKGLTVLAASLLLIVVATNAMTGALPGAAAMLIMASAIMVLTPALMLLGSMSLAEIGTALLALVGVFVVVGGASLILAPLTPVILALAAGIALLGVGVLAIGAGLLMFSAGLTALALAGTAGAAALVVAVTSIINLIPMALISLANGLLEFIKIIGQGTPIIMQALTAIVLGMIQVLVQLAPQLIDAVFVFLEKMLNTFLEYIPKLVDTGYKLLIGVLEGISKNIKEVVSTSLLIMEEFLRGLADGIPGVASAGTDVIVAYIEAIGKETPRIIDAGFKMMIDFINGLADSIRTNTPLMVTAFQNLADACIDGLIAGLLGGVTGAVNAIKDLGSSIVSGFKEVLGIASPSKVFIEAGEDTVDGFNEGVKSKEEEAEEEIKRLADLAINKAYETFAITGGKSTIFEQFGVINAESFISGLNSMGEAIKKSLKTVFGADKDTLKETTAIIDEALITIEERLESYTALATDRFNRISTESEITVAEMITNLKHNQMAIAEWADNIALLAERGLNEGLLEELRKAGPASAGEVKALVAASDTEIQELNTVMARGGQVATQALATSVGQGAPLLIEPGQSLVDAMANGITSNTSVNDAMGMLIDNTKQLAAQGLSTEEFGEMGRNIVEGLGSGILANTSGVTSAITTMTDLIKTTTTSELGIHSPSTVYAGYGEDLLNGFAQGITANSSKPIEAFNVLFTTMETQAGISGTKITAAAEAGLKANSAVFGQTGSKYGLDFSNELANKQTAAATSGRTVTNSAEQGLKSNMEVFGQTGTKYGTDFSVALSSTQAAANAAGKVIALEAEKGMKSNAEEFKKAGAFAAQGFIDGMNSMLQAVIAAAAALAAAALAAIEDELGIESPSKAFRAIGVFSGLGFVNGLRSMTGNVSESASEMGIAAIDGIKEAIEKVSNVVGKEIDSTITITPVLDLSNVQNGSKSIRQMLSGSQVVTPITTNVDRIAGQMNRNKVVSDSNPQPSQIINNKFEQNNYSPKPLSRLELYRQTKNLLTQQKGLVEKGV